MSRSGKPNRCARLGVDIQTGVTVGATCKPRELLADYDAVVIACGMGKVPKLGIPGEDAAGVWDALDFIRKAKLDGAVSGLGNTVAVIGGGNTAIDGATASKRLGASSVTMFYRRGPERMTAYNFEIEFAKSEGVEFRFNVAAAPDPDDRRPRHRPRTDSHRSRWNGAADCRQRIHDSGRHRDCAPSASRKFAALLDAFGVAHENGIAVVDTDMRTNKPRRVCGRRLHVPGRSERRDGCRSSGTRQDGGAQHRRLLTERSALMADLSIDLAGIRSPNPFWLASAPPTNSGYQVMRAFAAGWGGAVWKTLGEPIVNVTSRFAGLNLGATKMIGMNNIELITDRPLDGQPARDRRV